MFNLEDQAAVSEAQENGITVKLVDPRTGKDTGARIVMAGPDSRRARRARRDAWRHILAGRDDGDTSEISDEENREAGTRLMAGCVISWSGFSRDGKEEMDCTLANVLAVLSQVPWVDDELDLRFGNRSNFTQG